ncbi:MAG: hypothetical protein V2A73_22125 [Pseudomonadota bacterium]
MGEDKCRIPDWLLERILLGELPREQTEEVRRRLVVDGETHNRLEELAKSNDEILAAHPPSEVAAEVGRRLREPPGLEQQWQRQSRRQSQRPWRQRWRQRWGRWWDWGRGNGWWRLALPATASVAVVAGIAVVLTLVVVPRHDSMIQSASIQRPEPTREKGSGPRLVVHRKTATGSETIAPGAGAAPHDLLRLGYLAAGRTYGVIVSIDGRGVVSLHHPEKRDSAAVLAQGGPAMLSHAFELDDAPDYERFVLVTSTTPLSVETVLVAAQTLAIDPATADERRLELPDRLEQTSFIVRKVRP